MTGRTAYERMNDQVHSLVGPEVAYSFMPRAWAGSATPALNEPLLHKVMDHIRAHPEEHDQGSWARQVIEPANGVCGTRFCFAGHATMMTLRPGEQVRWDQTIGDEVSSNAIVDARGRYAGRISDRARRELGVTANESAWLFYAVNTRAELANMVQALVLIEQYRCGQYTECPHCYGTGKQSNGASCGPCHGKGWF